MSRHRRCRRPVVVVVARQAELLPNEREEAGSVVPSHQRAPDGSRRGSAPVTPPAARRSARPSADRTPLSSPMHLEGHLAARVQDERTIEHHVRRDRREDEGFDVRGSRSVRAPRRSTPSSPSARRRSPRRPRRWSRSRRRPRTANRTSRCRACFSTITSFRPHCGGKSAPSSGSTVSAIRSSIRAVPASTALDQRGAASAGSTSVRKPMPADLHAQHRAAQVRGRVGGPQEGAVPADRHHEVDGSPAGSGIDAVAGEHHGRPTPSACDARPDRLRRLDGRRATGMRHELRPASSADPLAFGDRGVDDPSGAAWRRRRGHGAGTPRCPPGPDRRGHDARCGAMPCRWSLARTTSREHPPHTAGSRTTPPLPTSRRVRPRTGASPAGSNDARRARRRRRAPAARCATR